MATIRKLKSGKWIAEVRIKGAEPVSKTHASKALAKDWADEEERKIRRTGEIARGKTLRQAFERYKDEVSPTKDGARWEIFRLNRFCREDEISNIMLLDLRREDFEDWAKARGETTKSSTVNRDMNLISSVLTWSRKWRWLAGNPLEGFKGPKDPPHRDRTISAEELARILTALDYVEGEPVTTNRQIIAVSALVSLETAMRQGEIWSLYTDRINREKRYALLPRTKNGESRKVPLSNRAIQLIDMLGVKEGKLITIPQGSAGAIYLRAVTLAGVKEATFHDLRHTALTRMARLPGMDMLTLAKIAGHKDPRNLMIYFNPTPKDISDILNG